MKDSRQKVDWDLVKDKVIELMPKHKMAVIAKTLGVSRQRLHQQIVKWGVEVRKPPVLPTDEVIRKCMRCGKDLPQLRKQRVKVCKECNERWVEKKEEGK